MLKRLMWVIFCLAILCTGAHAADSHLFKLTILHTNDQHCHLLPFNLKSGESVGGASRRAAMIAQIRAEMTNPVLLTDSGDAIWSSVSDELAATYHGAPTIETMNAMRYDAFCPGNHEFQWAFGDAMRAWKRSDFPWVCANLTDADGKLLFKPYIIKEIEGVKIAIFGLTTTWTVSFPGAKEKKIKALDPFKVAKDLVPKLRKEADIVLLVSHLGYNEKGKESDLQLAEATPGIDAILGGHSHVLLKEPVLISHGPSSEHDLNATAIVQAWQFGADLGVLNLTFHKNENGKYTLSAANDKLIRLTSETPEDPRINAIIKKYQEAIERGKTRRNPQKETSPLTTPALTGAK